MPYHDDYYKYPMYMYVPRYMNGTKLHEDEIKKWLTKKIKTGDTDGDEKMKDCCGNTVYVSNGLEGSLYKARIELEYKKRFTPLRIIFNDPATIVFWEDGTKTVVKCAPGTTFNKYAGFCAALAKHVYVSNSAINRLVNDGLDQNPPKPVKKATTKAKGAKK